MKKEELLQYIEKRIKTYEEEQKINFDSRYENKSSLICFASLTHGALQELKWLRDWLTEAEEFQ